MFDLGMTELLVIGIVALIVVGPKDLPGLFRSVGKFVGKAKGMAREFNRAMEQAADESGMKEVSEGLKAAANPTQFGMDKVKEATDGLTKWDPEDDSDKLSDERAEAKRMIQEATAQKAQARQKAEAAKAAKAAAAAEADQGAADTPPAEKAPEDKA